MIYYHKYLYMFRTSICHSSGVQVVCCYIWCSALVLWLCSWGAGVYKLTHSAQDYIPAP